MWDLNTLVVLNARREEKLHEEEREETDSRQARANRAIPYGGEARSEETEGLGRAPRLRSEREGGA